MSAATPMKSASATKSGQSWEKPSPLVKAPMLTCWNQDAGNARPIARPAPDSDETGTSRPEKLVVGMSARQVVPNTAATCVLTKVDIKRPNPVAAHTQRKPPAMSAPQEPLTGTPKTKIANRTSVAKLKTPMST